MDLGPIVPGTRISKRELTCSGEITTASFMVALAPIYLVLNKLHRSVVLHSG